MKIEKSHFHFVHSYFGPSVNAETIFGVKTSGFFVNTFRLDLGSFQSYNDYQGQKGVGQSADASRYS